MRNIAIINLHRLYLNAKEIRRRLPNKVKLCAVVKADAYGHGAAEVASAIYKICDCFAVALTEEAIALRRAGIDKDILVLIPVFKEDIFVAVKNGLTLSIQNVSDIRLAEAEGARQKRKVKVHVAINTGMNRLGADISEIDGICDQLKKCKYVVLDGVFSHYACPENKKYRYAARKKFVYACEKFQSINNEVIKHISSSGGFLKGDYFDMVRIGILLYGYKPFDSDINVKPVMKIKSRTLVTRRAGHGELAGYGSKPLDRKTKFSIVRLGYADGFLRKRTKGLANNRCMDTSLILGDFDGVIMDDADKVAQKTGTISYEVLCSATVRAEKKYIR